METGKPRHWIYFEMEVINICIYSTIAQAHKKFGRPANQFTNINLQIFLHVGPFLCFLDTALIIHII